MRGIAREIAAGNEMIATGRAREIRIEAGLSYGDVARELGVVKPTVWRWEHGHRRPRGELAARYYRLLQDLSR